jgi:transcription elongation factor GreA
MHKEYALTEEGIAKLEDELKHLETVRRLEVGQRIKEAKEFGDISENSEYDDAKNEQAQVEGRIAEITHILAHASVIDKPTKNDKVSLGSKVKLVDASGNERLFILVGSAEADPDQNKISNESPVGQAIFARKKGDKVVVNLPSGKKLEFTIKSISH